MESITSQSPVVIHVSVREQAETGALHAGERDI